MPRGKRGWLWFGLGVLVLALIGGTTGVLSLTSGRTESQAVEWQTAADNLASELTKADATLLEAEGHPNADEAANRLRGKITRIVLDYQGLFSQAGEGQPFTVQEVRDSNKTAQSTTSLRRDQRDLAEARQQVSDLLGSPQSGDH